MNPSYIPFLYNRIVELETHNNQLTYFQQVNKVEIEHAKRLLADSIDSQVELSKKMTPHQRPSFLEIEMQQVDELLEELAFLDFVREDEEMHDWIENEQNNELFEEMEDFDELLEELAFLDFVREDEEMHDWIEKNTLSYFNNDFDDAEDPDDYEINVYA